MTAERLPLGTVGVVEAFPEHRELERIGTDVERDVRELLASYLDAYSDADKEPLISISGLLWLYFQLFALEITFLASPLILVVNVIKWGYARGRSRPPRYLRFYWLDLIGRALASIHDGEMPVLKLLVVGSITRILLTIRIRSRTRKLTTVLQTHAIRAKVAGFDDLNRRLVAVVSLARQLNANVRNGGFAQLATAAVAATSAIGTILKILIDSKVLTVDKVRAALDALGSSEFDLRRLLLTVISPALLAFFFVPTASIVRRRELLLKWDVYKHERKLADKLGWARPREWPLDLLFTLGFLAVYVLDVFVLVSLTRVTGTLLSENTAAVVTQSVVFAIPIAYALFRRLLKGNY